MTEPNAAAATDGGEAGDATDPVAPPDPDGRRATIMISAGEASGDAHAAHALASLRDAGWRVASFGMGADALEAAGTDIVVDCRDLSVIGFVDVLRRYPEFRRRLERLRGALRERRPDLLLIVDYPDFNLKLAETARELGVPVLFYVGPQVWAWRAGRIPRIASLVSHLAVLFAFEVPIWREAGVAVTHVGHPMVREIDADVTVAAARARLGLADDDRPVVALLPGSRGGEIARHVPPMLAAAARIADALPGVRFVLPRAATVPREALEATIEAAAGASGRLDIRVVDDASLLAMRAADVVLVASGTATLETAVVGTPMVVLYRLGAVNHAIMSRLIRLPDIALVNIVAGRRVVPEFVQSRATPAALADAVLGLLGDPAALAAMRADLAEVRASLGHGDASGEVARIMASMLEGAGLSARCRARSTR